MYCEYANDQTILISLLCLMRVAQLLFVPVFYNVVYLWRDTVAFFEFWIIFLLFQMAATYWGHFLASVARNQQVATVLGALSAGLWSMSAGLTIAVRDIPDTWYWLTCTDPIRFVFNALIVAQMACDDPSVETNPGCSTLVTGGTAWDYVKKAFGFSSNDVNTCIYALIAFNIIVRILTWLAYARVCHLKR